MDGDRSNSDTGLSVVVPCFNEADRVVGALRAVLASPHVVEVIVVDDGSTDATAKLVQGVAETDERVRLVRQPCNLGKGAALRRGFREASAPFVIVQDADLEYDPTDWDGLIEPLVAGRADVVYGSRFNAAVAHRVLSFWHALGNRVLTTLSNMTTDLNLTDMETCSKAFRREVLDTIELHEDRFGIEPELTAKIAAGNWRVFEVGVTYNGRTYAEGKKIGWRDGARALWCIARYTSPGERVARRLNPTPTPLGFADAGDELATILEVLEEADAYADWVVSLFRDRLGGEILEVGAGVGSITRRLVECGSVVAVEPSSRSAALLAAQTAGDARVEVVSGTVDELPGDRRFDFAVLTNVLEHVPDDVGLLRDIRTRLADDGAVVCFVPAHPWLHSAFDDRVGHIRRYRRSQLAEVFGAAGYAVEQIRHVNAPGVFAWLIGARLLRMTPSPATTRLYQRMILPVVARLEARRELPFGQSLLVIARPADG